MVALTEEYTSTPVTDIIDVKFHHLVAYGQMTIKGLPTSSPITKVQLTASFDMTSTAQFSNLNISSDNLSYDYSGTSPLKNLLLMPKEGETEPSKVWFSTLPHTAQAGDFLEVKVTTLDGKSYTKKINYTQSTTDPSKVKGISFATGVISSFSVNFSGISPDVDSGYYTKVTSEQTDWSGKYLIVYEDTANNKFLAWDGKDADNGYVEVNVSAEGIILDKLTAAEVEIAPMAGGYSIKKENNKYIGGVEDNNVIKEGDTPILNTLSYKSNYTEIKSNTSIFKFNSSAKRFRYYKSTSSQNPVQLYKYSNATPSPIIEVTNGSYNLSDAAGSGSINYAIRFPVDGGAISAEVPNDCDWITDIDFSSPGVITFNVAANTGTQRSTTLTITYSYGDGQTSTKQITLTQDASSSLPKGTTINFGSASGSFNFSSATQTFTDELNNTWTGTATFPNNNSSFPNNSSDYSPIGSSKKPAETITLEMTLPAGSKLTELEGKFGGFSDTAGDISFILDNNTVKTGKLNASTDVTVTYSDSNGTNAQNIKITITNISKGVKLYSLTYKYI